MATIVRHRLVVAGEVICGKGLMGEVALFDLEGAAWAFTGGMSYGDCATECFEDVVLVGNSGTTEAPVGRGSGARGGGWRGFAPCWRLTSTRVRRSRLRSARSHG